MHHLQLQSRIVAVEFLMSERPLLPRIEDTYETFRSALEQNELDVPCFDRDQLAGPVNLAGNLGWVVVTANAQARRRCARRTHANRANADRGFARRRGR